MDNHLLYENTNGSIYPNDLVLNLIEDTSSLSKSTLSPSSSIQSLDSSIPTEIIYPCCVCYPKPNSHPFQERCIPLNEQIKIGRAVARLKPLINNAIFDCKVLSRQHARIWYENGKFLLQDTKSSNGTFVNNQRLGKCNEESEPYEIYSGDIIQFGVDVTENNRKTTHNCIIMEVKLFHSENNEALPRIANQQSLGQMKELDMNSQVVYQLAQYLQEAMHREQLLEQKLERLQSVIRDTQQTSDDTWQAILHEDRLLGRINVLEDQLRIYRTKNMTEDTIKQEFIQLTESHEKFEQESKTRLDKLLSDYATISGENRTIQTSLESTQNQLKYIEEQNEQFKQNIQDYIQSLDEQRLLISEIETKLKDSQTKCTEIEDEKQRIQIEFDEYYQKTKDIQRPSSPILENGVSKNGEEGEVEEEEEEEEEKEKDEKHAPSPPIVESPEPIVTNHIIKDDELSEAQKQIAQLREELNETNERVASTEDFYRLEQERYRSLKSDYETVHEQLSQLKFRVNREQNDNQHLVDEQQTELNHLSQRILSKQTEHDQLLSVYICFFLSCYLLIFFLFFFLLP